MEEEKREGKSGEQEEVRKLCSIRLEVDAGFSGRVRFALLFREMDPDTQTLSPLSFSLALLFTFRSLPRCYYYYPE
jgi:hypothetical protein